MRCRPLPRYLALAGFGVGLLLVLGALAAAAFFERPTAGRLMLGLLSVGTGVFTILWVLPDVLCYLGPLAGDGQPPVDECMDSAARAKTVSKRGDSGDLARPTATGKIIQLAEARRLIERE